MRAKGMHPDLIKNKSYKMKKITKITVLIAMLMGVVMTAQQDPHYTQYMYNQNVLNPAYAGTRGDLSIGLLARTQWVGIDGAPDTQTFNIHGMTGLGLGIGASVIHDKIGPIEETNLMLDLSYALQVSDKGKLSFGIKGSYNMLNKLMQSATEIIDQGDPLINEDYKTGYPNIGAGLLYYTDKFYMGLSVPGIMESFEYEKNGGHITTDISDSRHYFGTMGYVFDLDNNLKFKPSVMVKLVKGSPVSFDLNGSLFINDMFEIGLSYRDGDSIDALLGVQASPSLRVGYAYDHTLTPLGDYNTGSHELMLLFDMDFVKKRIKSPRYF